MNETIVAVSTAPGEGGIGIVRLSGDRAEEILARLYETKRGAEEKSRLRVCLTDDGAPEAFANDAQSGQDRKDRAASDEPNGHDWEDHLLFEDRKMHYGWIVDPVSSETIDEVLCVVMHAPHSYTGEDVAEIQCHGGPIPLRKILRACYALGAAPAAPGEFTKRAFLNGRIDLIQAGAVIDLINSRTDLSYLAARELADGRLSARIREARTLILETLAEIAVRIDYPEAFESEAKGDESFSSGEDELRNISQEESHSAEKEALIGSLRRAEDILNDLISGADRGRLVRDGLRTCIIGRPNVGKSSLYNALLRADAAIVTAEPGTTRDTLETWLDLGGAAVVVVDTAGIREDAGAVEQEGIKRAQEAYERADVCIFVLDGAAPLADEDLRIAKNLDKTKPTILALNKNDLGNIITDEEALAIAPFAIGVIRTTLATTEENEGIEPEGLSSLEELLAGLVTEGKMPSEQKFLVTKEAHKAALENAVAGIREGYTALMSGEPAELAEVSVNDAYRILGEIIGEEAGDDVINRVFEGFCVGK